MNDDLERNRWDSREAVVFRKTRETWGGLSNMAAGFPIRVGRVQVRTSEALYQAMRFSRHPEIQRKVLGESSPMAAKMVTKPFRESHGLEDWEEKRVDVMRWALRVKFACNPQTFGTLLRATFPLPIVEVSRRDRFWGATPRGYELLGLNTLGKLLMDLRDEIDHIRAVEPPAVELELLGVPIPEVLVSSLREEEGDDGQLNLF